MQSLEADDLLGMQLLMNPKKKTSMDVMSVASSYVSRDSGANKRRGAASSAKQQRGAASSASSSQEDDDEDDEDYASDSSAGGAGKGRPAAPAAPRRSSFPASGDDEDEDDADSFGDEDDEDEDDEDDFVASKRPSSKPSRRPSSKPVNGGGGAAKRRQSLDARSTGGDSVKSGDSLTSSTLSDVARIQKQLSQEEILAMKRELLYQFDRLERKGIRVPKKFTMASSLDEMRAEYERLKRDRETDVSVQFQRSALMTVVSGVEFLNNRFDPFDIKLNGWSDSINDSLGDYDEIFEELHEKYKGKGKMAPELRLLMGLTGSAITFHLTRSMFSTLPGAESVMRQNPELARQFAAASMQQHQQTQQQQDPRGGGGGGLMGFVGSLFGGGGGGGGGDLLGSLFGGGGGGGGGSKPPPAMQQQQQQQLQQQRPAMPPTELPPQLQPQPTRPVMRGPNMDDILHDIDLQAILNSGGQQQGAAAPPPAPPSLAGSSRVEAMSTVSESELSELQDAASVRGVLVRKSGGSGRGRGRPPGSGGVVVNKKQTIDI